jgi:hypothetical protein
MILTVKKLPDGKVELTRPNDNAGEGVVLTKKQARSLAKVLIAATNA